MEDLASLCNADDPSILSSAVHCLAALVSKKCCLVMVPSHLPCLAKLVNSSDDASVSAAVKVVHCIATTEASREALTEAGDGVGLKINTFPHAQSVHQVKQHDYSKEMNNQCPHSTED